MDENGATAPRYAGAYIVVDFDHEVIEAVIPTQPVAWFIGRPPEGPVVAAIGWIFTPGVVKADGPDRKERPRPRQAIGAPPEPDGVKSASRGTPVAFAFVGFDPAPAQRNPQWLPGPGAQPSLRAAAWPGLQPDETQRVLPHPHP